MSRRLAAITGNLATFIEEHEPKPTPVSKVVTTAANDADYAAPLRLDMYRTSDASLQSIISRMVPRDVQVTVLPDVDTFGTTNVQFMRMVPLFVDFRLSRLELLQTQDPTDMLRVVVRNAMAQMDRVVGAR